MDAHHWIRAIHNYVPISTVAKSYRCEKYGAKSYRTKFGVPHMYYKLEKSKFPKVLVVSKCFGANAITLGNFDFKW